MFSRFAGWTLLFCLLVSRGYCQKATTGEQRKAMERIGQCLDASIELDSALRCAALALETSESLGDQEAYDRAMVLPLAILVNAEADHERIDTVAAHVMEWAEANGRFYVISRAKAALGILAIRKGEWGEAIRLLEESAMLEKQGGRMETVIADLLNLGAAYGCAGRWQSELMCYREAQQISDSVGLDRFRPLILLRSAACFHDQYQDLAARRLYLACISTCGLEDDETRAEAYSGLATLYRSLNQFDSARTCLHLSDSILSRHGDGLGIDRNPIEAAKLEFVAGRYRDALRIVENLRWDDARSWDSITFYQCLQLRAFAYIALSLADSAEILLDRYDHFATATGNLRMVSDNRHDLAVLYKALGYDVLAVENFAVSKVLRDSISEMEADSVGSMYQRHHLGSGAKTGDGSWGNVAYAGLLGGGLAILLAFVWRLWRRRTQITMHEVHDEDSLEKEGEEVLESYLLHSQAALGRQNAEAVEAKKGYSLDGMANEESINESGDERGVSIQEARKLPLREELAFENPNIRFQDIICAKSQGHFFLLLYLDEANVCRKREVDTRTPRKLRLAQLQAYSAGRLLEPKRGYLVNPAYITLSEDGTKIYVNFPDAVEMIQANIQRKMTQSDGFFEEYPLPVASTPGKNFAERLEAWKTEFASPEV